MIRNGFGSNAPGLMTSFYAKLKRLRAMGPAEVCYRIVADLRDRVDKRRRFGAADETSESFIRRMAGEAGTVDEKMMRLFNNARQRTFFVWQKQDRNALLAGVEKRFAAGKAATLSAADSFLKNKFEIFGKPVSFAETIDWNFDPLSGRSIPLVWWRDVDYYSSAVVREVKYVWELNRCQHFVALGKAWFLTGDEKYARGLLSQWLHWIEQNPYKMGVNWAGALECAFRIISWTWALQFVKSSRELNPRRYARILQSVEQHALFISGHLSKYSSANNHLLGEALGLIYAGCYFPELPRAAEWRKSGFAVFERELLRQVHDDGVSAEQAFGYHRYVFDFGILAALAADHVGAALSPEARQRLLKMAEFYAAVSDDFGCVPAVGDDDGGRTLRLMPGDADAGRALLSTAAQFFQRADLHPGPGDYEEEAFWLLGEDRAPAERRKASEQSTLMLFPKGGYAAIHRDSPDRQQLLFDCGPLGLGAMAAHGHADALSLTLSVKGQPVLIDSGAYMYLGAGKERNYFRGTRAHSTVVVDGMDQSEMLGPFQWGRRAACKLEKADDHAGRIIVQAAHDGYQKLGVRHRRRIESAENGWLITDEISGVGIHQIDAYFQLAPCECSLSGHTAQCRFSHCSLEFVMHGNGGDPIELCCEQRPFSERFGEQKKHPVLRAGLSIKAPFILKTRITVDAQVFH